MYDKNILKASDFIEKILFEPIDLKVIAKHAAISPFHFHRIFRAQTGDNPMEFVRKRRLTVAADRLVNEETRVLDIALAVCFESQESFSRAFKKLFGCSPGEFRKNGHTKHMRCRYPLDKSWLDHLKEGITMEPEIKLRESFNIVGLARDFDPENKHEIGALWEKFVPNLGQVKNRKGNDFYGVICGWPNTDESEKQGRFSYAACVEVTSISEVPEGLQGREVPSGEYAVFTHKGSIADIHTTIDYIWGSWLPKSNYKARSAPDFERYDSRFNDRTMTGEFEIWIPVESH